MGAGGHAKACIDVIEQEGCFRIAGLVERPASEVREVLGYPVLGTDEDLPELIRQYRNALGTVGQVKTPGPRQALFERLKELGATLPTVVSSLAYVSRHVTLGEGTIVMHGAIVNAGAHVGRNCIVNTKALIEHDAVIEDHCHIATAAVVNGEAVIGEGAFVGSQAVIREGTRLGSESLVGAGHTVVRDMPAKAKLVK